MALPWLESTASAAGANNAAPPIRLAFIFFPNGAIMDDWRPQGSGGDFELSKTLSPLESHKSDLTIFSGLAQHHARSNGDGGGDHARNASAFLTGAQPRKTSGADIKVGQSIDQAIAERIGHHTRLPSLELGMDRGRNAGNCDSGYSCAYSSNISWKTENTPTAKEIHPRLAFERLFGNGNSTEEEKRRSDLRRSILDAVAEDASRLRPQLGRTDRMKLDEYFTSVREIEQRLARAATLPTEVPDVDMPAGMPREFEEHMRLMYDIMVLAFQTDSTRVCTFMAGNAGSNQSYPQVEVKEGHHQLSHHRDDKKKMDKIQRVDEYLAVQFAWFLERMKSVKEGNGTLLDNSMILYGSAISDANRHHHHDLPIVLAGRGGGAVSPGRHVEFDRETPLNNLFLSMADSAGAAIKELGDSTGRIALSR